LEDISNSNYKICSFGRIFTNNPNFCQEQFYLINNFSYSWKLLPLFGLLAAGQEFYVAKFLQGHFLKLWIGTAQLVPLRCPSQARQGEFS